MRRTTELIGSTGIVAVLRAPDATRFRAVAEALVDAGARAVEITLTAPDALNAITDLASTFGDEVALGAGTVLSADAAEAAVTAGASFLVAPTAVPDVVAAAQVLGVSAFPGALTPTEVLSAHRSGAQGVKLFPASAVGPRFIREIHGPLPGVKIMPTGGIAVDEVGEWIRVGAFAVGLGTSLLGDSVTDGPDKALSQRLRTALAQAAEARSALDN